MDLRADFRSSVSVDTNGVSWQPSPLPGVERRMLDRIGGEVARATSIVRYAANSRFSPHVHGGGEEFLVLDGVFSDEHGDYGPGCYVRNPPGSRHTPYSTEGCTLFVKLWQMDLADRDRVVIDTPWPCRRWPAIRTPLVTALCRRHDEQVSLERWPAGHAVSAPPRHRGLELLVLEGDLAVTGTLHPAGSWIRIAPDAEYDLNAPGDCVLWSKSGHLAPPRHLVPGAHQ